jgi:hypothetical protein
MFFNEAMLQVFGERLFNELCGLNVLYSKRYPSIKACSGFHQSRSAWIGTILAKAGQDYKRAWLVLAILA